MKVCRGKLAWGVLLVVLGVIMITMSGCEPAKASRQYRVSVYVGNFTSPVRTWVTDDWYKVPYSSIIGFESMGKKIVVSGNVVVEEL